MKRVFQTRASYGIFALCLFFVTLLTGTVSVTAAIPEQSELFYVNDTAGVLNQDTCEYIYEKNLELAEYNGGEIVVATVDLLDGKTIKSYAEEMFENYEIGHEKNNNGVLILFAVGEDNYYVSVGSSLTKQLSGSTLDGIFDQYTEPYFAEFNYDDAAYETFEAIYPIVWDAHSALGSSNGNSWTGLIIFLVTLGGIALVVCLIIYFSNRKKYTNQAQNGAYTDPNGAYNGNSTTVGGTTHYHYYSPRPRRAFFFFGPRRPPRPPRYRNGWGAPPPAGGPRPPMGGGGSTGGNARPSSNAGNTRPSGGGTTAGGGAGRSASNQRGSSFGGSSTSRSSGTSSSSFGNRSSSSSSRGSSLGSSVGRTSSTGSRNSSLGSSLGRSGSGRSGSSFGSSGRSAGSGRSSFGGGGRSGGGGGGRRR